MVTSIEDRPVDGAKKFALYLKEHPEGTFRPAAELAREFDLSLPFVTQVLRGLTPPRKPGPPSQIADWGRVVIREAQDLWHAILQFVAPIVVLTLYGAGVMFLFRTLSFGPNGLTFNLAVAQEENLRIFSSLFITHCVLFYASGNLRAVWLGVVHTFTMLLMAGTFIRILVIHGAINFAWLVAMTIQGLAMATIYGVFSTAAAAAGAIVKYNHQDQDEARLGRQDLLEKLFSLEQRLSESASTSYRPVKLLPSWLWIPFEHASIWRIAAYGSFLGIAQLLVDAGHPNQISPGAGIYLLGLLLVSTVTYIGAGYTATTYRSALFRSFVVYVIILLFELVPVNGYGPANVFREGTIAFSLVLAFVMGSAGFLVAQVEQRTAIGERLAANDPAALLAEIVRVEWRLKSRAQEVVVVNVDAARSAEMKAQSDPLVAEYSFREYQEFLKMICESNHGFVYSTAGDGAILAFQNCEDAFRSSREIQTNISYFNEHVNRMKAKFRLRVGIHMGEISGDIREVEFTEVIDIAAHVQGAAPIRGIVVTKPVAERIHNEHLIPLKDPVDGYEVMLAYNPTVEM